MAGRGRKRNESNGFAQWGGYMAAKIAKLSHQYESSVPDNGDVNAQIFNGIAIFVNGYTEPSAEGLKRIMMNHGGIYHHYYSSSCTTHIVASNLPNTKILNLNTERCVKPDWIVDSLEMGKLLDYRKYILYTNQSIRQPKLQFDVIKKPDMNIGCQKIDIIDHEGINSVSSCTNTIPLNIGAKFPNMPNNSVKINHDAVAIIDESGNDVTDAVCKDKCPGSNSVPFSLLEENRSSDQRQQNATIQNIINKTDIIVKPEHESHQLAIGSLSNVSKCQSVSTANPKFLSEFYNNSRLHHISTMGAVFKQYVNDLQSKGSNFPGRQRLKEQITKSSAAKNVFTLGMNPESRTIMHIDMDCFFVSVGLKKHPELRGQPIAVTHSKGNPVKIHDGQSTEIEGKCYRERADKKAAARKPVISSAGNKPSGSSVTFAEVDVNSEVDPHRISFDLVDESSSKAEIASCSYEARASGLKNGMYLGAALKLCPQLVTIPYDFDGYKEVSFKLYNIVASYTHNIEAVSCDEMYVDLTELLITCSVTAEEFTRCLRNEIQEATGCPCSAGLAPNMLLARLATRLAKPNGQYLLTIDAIDQFMLDQIVNDLPGVGRSLGSLMKELGLKTCRDLQLCSLGKLQSEFGTGTGKQLFQSCRGIDNRLVKSEHQRKSVSAEVNYGIRFTNHEDAFRFIHDLSTEVESRLKSISSKGKCITLKLKIRSKDAPVQTAKFMGHGVCDNFSKSCSLSVATDSVVIIEREVLNLLKHVKSSPQDFRGVGIQVSRLESSTGRSHPSKSNDVSIRQFFAVKSSDCSSTSIVTGVDSAREIQNSCSSLVRKGDDKFDAGNQTDDKLKSPSVITVTSDHSDKCLDVEVLRALPIEIRDQIIAEYRQQGYQIPDVEETHSDDDIFACEPGPSGAQQLATTSSHYPGNASQFKDRIVNQFASTDEDSNSCDALSHNPTITNEKLVTSFSEVDSSFLDALPADLKLELERDFQEKKRVKAPTVTSPVKGSPTKFSVPQLSKFGLKKRGRPLKNLLKNKDKIAQHILNVKISTQDEISKVRGNCDESNTICKTKSCTEKNVSRRPNLCGVDEVSDVKNLLKQWLISTNDPECEDVHVLLDYFIELLRSHDLETVDLLLKFLHRQICKSNNQHWQISYFNIINLMQKEMVNEYQYKLSVNLSFL